MSQQRFMPSRSVAFQFRWWIVLVATLILAISFPPCAGSEETEPIYVRHSDRFESTARDDQQITSFIGHVLIEHQGTIINCGQATYYKDEGKVFLYDNVHIEQSQRTIWADRAEYDEGTRLMVGLGDSVVITDHEKGVTAHGTEVHYAFDSESGYVTGAPVVQQKSEDGRIEATLEGDTIFLAPQQSMALAKGDSVSLEDRENGFHLRATKISYNYDRKHGVATGRPRILRMDEDWNPILSVISDTVEVYSEDDRCLCIGDVILERETFTAKGQWALFSEKGETVTLRGEPMVYQSENTLSGDEIALSLRDWTVTRVLSTGHARASTVSQADSTAESVESSELSGRQIELYFENEEAESLVVTGSASSVYRATDRNQSETMNEASGDTITLYFDQGSVNRTCIRGGARGTYSVPPASEEEPGDTVVYRSDRIDYRVDQKIIFLEGSNRIEYQDIVLTAGHVAYNTTTHILTAEGRPDSSGRLASTPVLKDGPEKIEGAWMAYNLKTKKGKITQGGTQFEKGFYTGIHIRKVADSELNIDHGTYTTCDQEKPHYHFYTRRMKVYQDDKVIAKPVVLYFRKLPVFILPFYIFPIQKGRHSGLLVPRYGSTDVDGRYLRDAGYYIASSEYWDTLFKISLYERTGWMLESRFRYALRYQFNGTIGGSYRWDQRAGIQRKRWNFKLNHTHTITPTLTLKASGNFMSDKTYTQDVSESSYERMERTLRSEVVLDQKWEGSSLSLRMNRERNLDRDRTTDNLPILTFRKSQRPIFGSPSEDEAESAEEQPAWYRSLFYSYNMLFVNWHQEREGVSTRHVGADHRINLTGSQTLGGWLGLNPRVNLRETWFDEDTEGRKWVRRGYYDTGLSVNTTLYGLFRPNIGPLTMLRHKLQPRLSFSYRPEFTDRDRYYSFGGIGGVPGPQKTLGIGVSNFFQGKTIRGDREKKFDIATFDLSTGYNFRAEGQKFSSLSSVLRVNPSKVLGIDMNTSHSFYDLESGEFVPLRPALQNFSITTNLRFRFSGREVSGVRREEQLGEYEDETFVSTVGREDENRRGDKQDARPWDLSLSHYYSLSKLSYNRRTQWLNGRVSFFLPKSERLGFILNSNWKIGYSAKYDLEEREFTSQRIEVYRDLHCWEANFVWIPTGGREGYYFKINVKALPELKIERGKGIAGIGL
jgi:lipopolysaccharide assembly outer membrane protein LptD (OstA)